MNVLIVVTSLLLAQSTFKTPEKVPTGSPEAALCDLEAALYDGTRRVELAGDVVRIHAANRSPAKHTYKVKAGECYALFAAASSPASASATGSSGGGAVSLTLRAKGRGIDTKGEGTGARAGVDFCADKSSTLTVEVAATEAVPIALGLWKLTPITATIGLRPSFDVLSRAGNGGLENPFGDKVERHCFAQGSKSSPTEGGLLEALEKVGRD
jgi:hypothetical protein